MLRAKIISDRTRVARLIINGSYVRQKRPKPSVVNNHLETAWRMNSTRASVTCQKRDNCATAIPANNRAMEFASDRFLVEQERGEGKGETVARCDGKILCQTKRKRIYSLTSHSPLWRSSLLVGAFALMYLYSPQLVAMSDLRIKPTCIISLEIKRNIRYQDTCYPPYLPDSARGNAGGSTAGKGRESVIRDGGYRYVRGKLATTARDTGIYIYVHTRAAHVGGRIDRPAYRDASSCEVALRNKDPMRKKNREVEGSCSRGFRLEGFSPWNPSGIDVLTRVYIDVIYGQTDIYINKCSIGTVSKIRWDHYGDYLYPGSMWWNIFEKSRKYSRIYIILSLSTYLRRVLQILRIHGINAGFELWRTLRSWNFVSVNVRSRRNVYRGLRQKANVPKNLLWSITQKVKS